MSKYRLSQSSICIDGTAAPKNKFNNSDVKFITTMEKLLLLSAYSKYNEALNPTTLLDENYFISLHKKTFEALYTFAGIYRNVKMSKGESQSCLAQYLDVESKRIFTELKEDNYLQDIFVNKLTYYQGELIALHPFYELNSLIIRLYCGYKTINYSDDIDNGAYIDTSIACVQYADSSFLEKIIFNGLSENI